MPFSLGAVSTRTSSTGNPITVSSYVVNEGETLLVLTLKVNGATDRTGGAPTYGSSTFTQANITQKAVTTPEASTELWYLINPTVGSATITIPNSGALTVFYTMAAAKASGGGGKTFFVGATGANNTSTNPSPGALASPHTGNIFFATVCNGATTWNPSAQAGTGYGGTGTSLGNFDDGALGGGQQYLIQNAPGSATLSWTFGTSEDWGSVVACFAEVPATAFNNYGAVNVGSGLSTGERIR